MSNALSIIGRVAQLCNLIAKPELNGCYVIVENFDSEKERYGVRTLVPPNAVNAVPLLLSVKVTSLQFREEATFASRFPDASVVTVAASARDIIVPGVIIDFSHFSRIPIETPIIIHKSCFCRGTPSTLSSTGEARPSTVVQNNVSVEIADDGVVEFEDINFDNIVENGGFSVYSAKHVAFRRCRFHSTRCGIVIGAATGICHASFENCLFEDTPHCGMAVFENAHVTMINCVFRAPGICSRVNNGGRFTAIHCTFHGPVRALEKVPSFELINSTIIGSSDNGVGIGNATNARLQGCRVIRCKRAGVAVTGLKRVTVHIEDCVVTECGTMGFLIDMGKVNVTLVNSQAFNNKFHGLHLGSTLCGSATVNNCTFRDNRGAMDFVKLCGPECTVTIDGVVMPLDLDVGRLVRVMEDMMRCKAEDYATGGEYRVSLDQRRVNRKALGAAIHCLNCNKPEPKNVKFKACANCKEEVYCSRDCQVAHWKEHKKECGKVKYG